MVHFIGKTSCTSCLVLARDTNSPVAANASVPASLTGWSEDQSRGTFLTAESYLKRAQPVAALLLRCETRSAMEDIDLNLGDFVARVNSDLVGKYVNIASRAAGFISKRSAVGHRAERRASGARTA
jgi:methionyl-tRNA synthetase